MNVDDLFAYSTTKSIKIRDARLGLLHYTLMFFIFVYILVYQLIYNLGYLKFAAAQNSVRLTLQEPTKSCNPNDSDCQDSFVPISHLPYCCAPNSSCKLDDEGCHCDYRPSFKDYNCTWLSGDDAVVIKETSIMVTTFTHEYSQKLNASCFTSFPDAGDTCDKLWIVESRALVFTADVEAYTMLIDHSVMSPASGLATTSREMKGMLFVDPTVADSNEAADIQHGLCQSRADAVNAPFGGQATDSAPCYLKPKDAQGLDYFEVGTLLQAMGVSLEGSSYPGSNHSARYEGFTGNIVIEYSNTRLWHGLETNISYIYRPSAMPQSTYKSTAITSTSLDGSQRLKRDMHGMLFEVKPGGDLAIFDFTQLLLQLTTSLTLLAMATIGVNILAQYVLSKRHYYVEALCEQTADFHHLSFLESQSESQIQEELRRRHLPNAGTKEGMILRLLESGFSPPARSGDSLQSGVVPNTSTTGGQSPGAAGSSGSLGQPLAQSE